MYTNFANIYKLRSWINKDNLVIDGLCSNKCEGAIVVFNEKNKDNLDWKNLQHNRFHLKWNVESNYNLTEKHYEWMRKLIFKDPSKINWSWLSNNPCDWAGQILENNVENIDWKYLCQNIGEWVCEILLKHPDKIHWYFLCNNKASWVRRILEIYPDNIHWYILCSNPAEWVLQIIEKNWDKINWHSLSQNTSEWAMKMLEKNEKNISWLYFSANPSIFVLDYSFLEKRMENTFEQELIAERFHPKNIPKFKSWGYDSGYGENEV